MPSTRTARLTLTAGALAGAALLAGLALPTGACPEPQTADPRITLAASPGSSPRFAPQSWEGLGLQLQSITASAAHSIQGWGQPGARHNRNLSINGVVFDPSGGRIYRLAGPPRIRELTDERGNDLAATAQYTLHPQPSYSRNFVRPTSSQTSMNFGLNAHSLEAAPRGLKRLALEIDVELAADVKTIPLPREAQPEMLELAPNFQGRVTNFVVTGEGRVSVKFEYRIGLGDGPRPAFYAIELLDTSGALIQSNYPPQEIVTRDAIVGTHHIQNVGLGSRELGEVRLTIITDLIAHTFELVEEDLPLLD